MVVEGEEITKPSIDGASLIFWILMVKGWLTVEIPSLTETVRL